MRTSSVAQDALLGVERCFLTHGSPLAWRGSFLSRLQFLLQQMQCSRLLGRIEDILSYRSQFPS